MQRFHRHAENWQCISRISGDFQPLVEQGQFAQAEALLDRALSVLEAGPSDLGNLEHLDQFRREVDETQYLVLPLTFTVGPSRERRFVSMAKACPLRQTDCSSIKSGPLPRERSSLRRKRKTAQ